MQNPSASFNIFCLDTFIVVCHSATTRDIITLPRFHAPQTAEFGSRLENDPTGKTTTPDTAL
eukprot:m.613249 g.613249  ORF g.613249 m.613249 type:complete len:62 (-) comp22501_c0_seq3:113-298(-)